MTLFDKALCFAVEKHSGQTRKVQNSPYILHPIEVAAIVGTMTNDEATLCAAVLHDTIEDTDTTLEEIRENFGKRVSLLVMTETENKRADRPAAETWHLRKEETLIMLEHTKDISVKMMWLGDKLSNVRSFYREYLKKGDELWQQFNQKDPREQAWYYHTIIKSIPELKDTDAYREFVQLVNEIFKNVDGGTNNEAQS
ncbi:MAG: HD domain-containing protein [Bacillota bacterium]|nr:HD domain-containing protein [Bacillota bacterium]